MRRLVYALLGLLTLCGVFLIWAFNTQAGAGFVLARVQSALDGKLGIGQLSGTLSGPLQLENVRYVDPTVGIDARIEHVSVDLAVWALLARRVEISRIEVAGVDVALSSLQPDPNETPGQLSLVAPIDVVVNELTLQRATISRNGVPVLNADRLDLVAGWTRSGIIIKQLALRSPDGSIDLTGALGNVNGVSGSAETTFSWGVGETELAGVLKSSSDGQLTRLDLSLTQPTAATLAVTIGQNREAAWTLKLDVAPFDAKKLLADSDLGTLALNLQGSGSRERGSLSGSATINGHAIDIDPLSFALNDDDLKIESLTLRSPDATGALELNGAVHYSATPPSATLNATWQGVELPADLVGQTLATHGRLEIDGSAELFNANGELSIGPANALADIELDIQGTPQAITLNTLRLKQKSGGLNATGSIALRPTLGWQIEATANRLDPGAFFVDWPGAVDFDISTAGTVTDQGPEATLILTQLGGSLRKRPISGSADLRMHPGYAVDGKLTLHSGNSQIEVEGSRGKQTDAKVRFAIASLGDWWPGSGGQASGTLHVLGKWPQLDIDGDLIGRDLAWSGTRISSLEVVGKIKHIDSPSGAITLNVENVVHGDMQFDRISVRGNGNEGSHTVDVNADSALASLSAAIVGGHVNGRWNGQIKSLELTPSEQKLPRFALNDAASMTWTGKHFEVSEACLVGHKQVPGNDKAEADADTEADKRMLESLAPKTAQSSSALPATLCASGSSDADGSLVARYRLERLPLRMLQYLGAPDSALRLRGQLRGEGEIGRVANGPLTGSARLISDEGRLVYNDSDSGNLPVMTYANLLAEARFSATSSVVRVHAALDNDGRVDANITLSPADGSTQTLDGQIELDINNLGFLELFTSALSNTKGRITAQYSIAGTLAEPRLDGELALENFAAEIAAAGLKLRDGKISVRAADAQSYTMEGSIASGTGTLIINGEGGFGAKTPMKISLKGEDFLAADIPAARVVIAPDLTLSRDAEGIFVTGRIGVPVAAIDLSKLPGGGASKVSRDVVVVDATRAEPGRQQLPITASVTVALGDAVKLVGYGFDGTLSGDLIVNDRPHRATTATGSLNAGGTYKAYGQDLKIETGRVLFAGTAIDNPALDIRATRKVQADSVSAGLLVRGTAQAPVLTVFGIPAMTQSEALSYLVTGKPLSGLKSGEGEMLGSAARALGTVGGDLLAKNIGGRMGVDDIGVSENAALGGAAFTVGKYLSPKLYLSYGVGIFEPGNVVVLRYILTPHWNFEAQNSTNGNRAGINYRYEK